MTLIGPKPDVDEPDAPTPWEACDSVVLDANGAVVLAVLVYDGEPGTRDRIAEAVADTINRDHGQQDDELTVKLAKAHLDNRDLRQKLFVADQAREELRADRDRLRDELAHMSARRRYEGIDAPAPELPTDAARNIAALTSALKLIDWQCNRDHGSQWLAGQLHDQGIRVQLPPVTDADPLAHVRPGDPDPTAKRVSGVDCDAEWNALPCTREGGHPGHHIAGGEDEVVAVWRADA